MIEVVKSSDEIIYIFNTNFTTHNITEMINNLHRSIVDEDKDVVLDFSNIAYMESMFLAALIKLKNKFVESGLDLRIINANESVTKVIELAGVDSFLLE